jgi:SAM-dependent methyltransferase
VIWHEVECGSYRADLPLWRELAAAAGSGGELARVLDLGAGIGRVTLDLAAAGHAVSAVDISPSLLDELTRRAGELPVRTLVGDIRKLALDERDFDLCVVPMQTIQLLRGPDERRAAFRGIAEHLRPGALAACAIVTEADEFDALAGDLGPSPDRMARGDHVYFSRPLSVAVLEQAIRIERERVALPGDGTGGARWRAGGERDVIELARVSEEGLWVEAEAAGLRREPSRLIPETEEHTASEVVMLRA